MTSTAQENVKTPYGVHTSVLLKEIVDGLNIQKGDTVVDGTVNGGGMSEEILKRFSSSIKLICIDQDGLALEKAKERLTPLVPQVLFLKGNFRNLKKLLESVNVSSIDRLLLDLGLSSNQLEAGGRGFSFQKDEPLRMTYDEAPSKDKLTAYDVVNHFDEENLVTILRAYGEDRNARRIARTIVESRGGKLIETSRQLADIVLKASPRRGRIHPATKTFQAIRMAVNDELSSLKEVLGDGFSMLSPHGRLAVISFHSLEDRLVKNFMRDLSKEGSAVLLTKKPLVPGEEEIESNPRSRSAKLRIIEKV